MSLLMCRQEMFSATIPEPYAHPGAPSNNHSHFPFFLANKTLILFTFLGCHDLGEGRAPPQTRGELCWFGVHHGDSIPMAKSLI